MEKTKENQKQVYIKLEKSKNGVKTVTVQLGMRGQALQRIREKYDGVFKMVWNEIKPTEAKTLIFELSSETQDYQLV